MRADEVALAPVVEEVLATFERYEAALVANNVDVLDELFWRSPMTIRYGVADVQHGWDDVSRFRRGLEQQTVPRRLEHTVVTTFGSDVAVVATEFVPVEASSPRGRQSQTWVRFAEGWRVVAAHVSLVD